MGFLDKIKKLATEAEEQIEQGTTQAIDNAEADGTLREHQGEPIRKSKKD